MTKAKLTRIPKRVLACVLAVLMVLSCLTMLPFTGFAANENHAKLESPAVVQDGNGTYYAFGNDGVVYKSSDMANWELLYGDESNSAYGYLAEGAFAYIRDNLFGDSDLQQNALDSPEVVNINGKWYLYLSIMDGSRSMIVVGTSNDIKGPYGSFQKVLETGFNRGDATDVLQSYFGQSYGNNAMPQAVKDWGKGTCYYYSNILGLNYQWFTEELPRAYAPSIAQDNEGNYWMAYGYRDGGIWIQKLHKDGENAGLIDFTWSGDNWNNGCTGDSAEEKRSSANHYLPEDCYDTAEVDTHRLDPYFGQLIAHTTEGGDTDTLESSVSRAGEEPELYFVGDQAYLQVTYGGSNNSDGYNVRSYKDNNGYTAEGVTAKLWNFADMNDESGVDNADASMIGNENSVKRTGLKLMGDYNLPGTPDGEYYTSPGASSVTQDEDGMLFYNYQVKTNNSSNGTTKNANAEMRSHILLHNKEDQPLVMPFEYTGAADKALYEAAIGDESAEYDIDNDIAGQYYVTMTTDETSTAKQGITGLTLTAGHLVAGAFSGSWDFEDITLPNGTTYQNGLVITDENGNKYHGAFLKQTPEDPSTLNAAEGKSTPVTFAIVVGNTTYWGVWYDKYAPASENNADAGLSVSPAIYTGGALQLNSQTNGQLGLRYGNYITAFKFADIDYSTYLMIDDEYTIDSVVDDDHDPDGENNGIDFMPVDLDGTSASDFSEIINAVYLRREKVDAEEADAGGDAVQTYEGNAGSDSVNQLVEMLIDKAAEARQLGKKLYILTGYLNSAAYGRAAHMDRDKGAITLMIKYYEDENEGSTFSERIYSHVYQQPVPANLSASVYNSNNVWVVYNRWENSVFLRAEGSFATDSYFPDGSGVRNDTIRTDGSKKFSAKGIYLFYNPTLYDGTSEVLTRNDLSYYHGETTSFLVNGSDIAMNSANYRNTNANADVVSSYEMTVDDNGDNGKIYQIAGPRAEYYIDVSSSSSSNIGDYITNNQLKLPLYYSSVPISGLDNYSTSDKNFDYGSAPGENNEARYRAGLYSSDRYWEKGYSNPLGWEGLVGSDASYPFTADFSDVQYMYEEASPKGFSNSTNTSAGANVTITANLDSIKQGATADNYKKNASEYTTDYNFYVRSKVETTSELEGVGVENNSYLRMATDLEYGIYVSDKSYVRDYYDSITQGKFATGYTYYSWEAYRDATRLVADYLNNYMDLADSNTDTTTDYNPNEQHELDRAKEYRQWLKDYNNGEGISVDDVLNNEAYLDAMLTRFDDQVQEVYCFLLNDAVERLFDFEYYNEFNQAYQQYEMLDNYDEYTTSSWQAYQQYRNIQVANGLTLEALAGYDWRAVDDPEHTPDDPNDNPDNGHVIYNPTNPNQDPGTVDNNSWKIINDEFFKQYDMTAREIFAKATELINEAMDVLRHKADYDDLDEQMSTAESYKGNLDIASSPDGSNVGILSDANMGENATVKGNSDIFSIDRSTVNALANQMDQGTNDSGNSYVKDNANNRYTISSMAAFDKVYQSIWEVTDSIDTTTLNGAGNFYYDSVAEDDVEITDRKVNAENKNDPNSWYSKLLRDDQQYFTNDSISGEDTEHLSTVQQKIVDKTTQMQMVLNYLKANKMAESLEDQYQTFDYLIDVISTIDFNAYTPAGQELLWNKLYELLVQGGVYLVNQQLFDPNSLMEGAAIDKDSPLYEVLYGDEDKTYYTGWNATNVDAATTELMELLTKLDTENDENGTPYLKQYNVHFVVNYYDDENGEIVRTFEYNYDPTAYNSSLTLKINDIPEIASNDTYKYDPYKMYARSWVVEVTEEELGTKPTVSNLRDIGGEYTYSGGNDATITVDVVLGMPDPVLASGNDRIPVIVSTRFNERNELALNLSQKALKDYSVSVTGNTLKVTNANGEVIANVEAAKMPYHTFNGWFANNQKLEAEKPYTLQDFYDADDNGITITTSYFLNGFEHSVTVNGIPYSGAAAADNGAVKHDAYISINPANYPISDSAEHGTFYAWLVKSGDANAMNEENGADKDWKIAAYTETYSYNVPNGSQVFTQVNYDEATDTYWIYDPEKKEWTAYDEQSQYEPVDEDEGMKEFNTNSWYYRLSRKLRDSWSSMTAFDATSNKIALFSHFTAADDIPDAATVAESGCVAMYVDLYSKDVPEESVLNESLQIDKPNVNKFVSTASTSTTSEGQYTMAISFPENMVDDSWAIAMRSYVTYSYYGWDAEKQEYGEVFRTVYSDVKLAELKSSNG